MFTFVLLIILVNESLYGFFCEPHFLILSSPYLILESGGLAKSKSFFLLYISWNSTVVHATIHLHECMYFCVCIDNIYYICILLDIASITLGIRTLESFFFLILFHHFISLFFFLLFCFCFCIFLISNSPALSPLPAKP